MTRWVALLRGINVGGHAKLTMADLRALLEAGGAQHVSTYIQSGNVVFEAEAADPVRIEDAIEAEAGFRPRVLLLPGQDFLDMAAGNPFPEGVADPKTLHLYFLAGPPAPEAADRLAEAAGPRERAKLTDRVMYLHTLDYLSGSAIAQKAETLLGTAATARNWNTVSKLCQMLGRS